MQGDGLMGEVLEFTGATKVDIPPEKVIEGASEERLKSVFIVGWDQDDNLFMASSDGSIGEILHLLEIAKRELLNGD